MIWFKHPADAEPGPQIIKATPPQTDETNEQDRTRAHDEYAIKLMLERVFPKKPHLKVENCFGGDGDPHRDGGFDPHSW